MNNIQEIVSSTRYEFITCALNSDNKNDALEYFATHIIDRKNIIFMNIMKDILTVKYYDNDMNVKDTMLKIAKVSTSKIGKSFKNVLVDVISVKICNVENPFKIKIYIKEGEYTILELLRKIVKASGIKICDLMLS